MSDNTRLAYADKVFKVSLIGNIILSILKGIIGVIFNSTAMIADALHSMSDVLSTMVAIGGIKYAHRPPDESHHYGHGKAEIIATKILALILVITALGMGWFALNVIRQPILEIPGIVAIWGAALSLIIKEAMFQYTFKIGTLIGSSALKADAWHHRSDAWSSLAALIGIIGAINGFPLLDPIAALVVAAMILRMGIKVYWNSLKELMDPAPAKETLSYINGLAEDVKGVRGVHDVKARLQGNSILVDLKICVDPLVTVEEGHDVAAACRRHITGEIPQVEDVLVHVNPCFEKGKDYCCEYCVRYQEKEKKGTKEE